MKSELKKINIVFIKTIIDGIYKFNAGESINISIEKKFLNSQPYEIMNSSLDEKTKFLLLQIINKTAQIKTEIQ